MQETPMRPEVEAGTAETAISEYVQAALTQTDLLRNVFHDLQKNGGDLSLSAWHEAFEACLRTLEHINKAVTLAQAVFDGHEVQVSGALSEDLICDEFQCLTWK